MIDHFLIGPEGDACEPDGYSLLLSKALVTLALGSSPEYAARKISIVRRYLNHVMTPGESPRSVLEEPTEAGAERVIHFLAKNGITAVPSRRPNCENEFELRIRKKNSTVHAQQIVAILRQFYQLCGSYGVGRITHANPVELPGWHLRSEEQRRESWQARFPKRPYGWMNAGLRFKVAKRKPYLPLIEDPASCAELMTAAVIKYGCPTTVIAICMVLEDNGCRWREAAWVNALGWSIKGFDQFVYTSNKHDGNEFAKAIVLRPEVLSATLRRFEQQPHPTVPDRTMMDRLRELAAAGDRAALAEIPLFPNRRGRRHQHRTFNGHWFAPAMAKWPNEDGSLGLRIFSEIDRRQPTPHWYRHAEITRQLEAELGELRTDAAIEDACRRVCRRFALKTDQARRYAAALMTRIAREQQMIEAALRRRTLEDRRRTADLPPTLPRQSLSEAERFMIGLPDRRLVAA